MKIGGWGPGTGAGVVPPFRRGRGVQVMTCGIWPRYQGRESPALRAGAVVPMKIGSLRGDILFESKEYPLALPKKDCQGGISNFPPDNPLETTKGRGPRAPSFGIPPLGWDAGDGHGVARTLRCARGRGMDVGVLGGVTKMAPRFAARGAGGWTAT